MDFYASPEEEIAATRRAALRAGCSVRSLRRGSARVAVIGGLSRVVGDNTPATIGELACRNGWAAARLLLALAIEDARSPGAVELARELRAGAASEGEYARIVHAYVGRIPFVRERGEIFQSGGMTIRRNAGDCDDHFRLAYALGVAGGLRAALGVLHHGTDVPVSKQGPAHAVALFYVEGGWTFAETTVEACWGENPNDATRRLGLTNERSDIAKELRIMTEQDLPDPPRGFRARNSSAQVALDARALQVLGYLSADAPVCQMTDPTFAIFRRAVLAFQLARGLAPDGLVGPHTREILGRDLVAAGAELEYPTMGEVVGGAPKASAHLTDEFLRMVAAMAERFRARGATAAAEDWLQVWTYESGINSHQQTRVINPSTGKAFDNAGINQMGGGERRACGFGGSLEEWLALSNEEQLPFVECYYESALKTGGTDARAYRGGGSVYVATFAPAHLRHSGEPSFPLYSEASTPKLYQANRGLDRGGKKFISVDDMRLALERVSRDPLFVEARERVRALGAAPASPEAAPGATGGLVASLVFVGAGGALAYAYARGWL